MSLSTRTHFHHLGSVAATAGLILAAGLALAAGPNDPQGDQPNGAKAEKRYNWSDLPSTDQVKRVSIKKIEPSEASPANAEIHFELGKGAPGGIAQDCRVRRPSGPGRPGDRRAPSQAEASELRRSGPGLAALRR